MYEGIGIYFWLLFLIYLIINFVVKYSLSKLFKGAKVSGWKAFIPFYNRIVIIKLFDLKKSLFLKTLIPIFNLYYYYVIISRMLEVYGIDTKEAIWFLIIPIYKFPELAIKNPIYNLHMYDNTKMFIKNEDTLFNSKVDEAVVMPEFNIEIPKEVQNNVDALDSSMYNQVSQNQYVQNISGPETVFSNSSLEPDKRKETIIEAKKEEVQEQRNPIYVDNGKARVCPRCKTQLPSTAKVCFFCGTQLP